MSMSSLRQGATRVSNQSQGKGGGSKGGYFNKWRPPKVSPQLQGMLRPNEPAGDPIMLTRPETLYDDVYDTDEQGNPKGTKVEALHIKIHQVKGQRNGKEFFDEFVCSAGPNPHAPQPCVGEVENDKGNKTVSAARQNWAFGMKHLVPYHRVPLVDKKTNQIKYKENSQEAIMIMKQCEVGTPEMRLRNIDPQTRQMKPCQYCASNFPQVYGAPKVYQLGKNHLEELLKVGDQLDQTCTTCMTRLLKIAYNCGHCGVEILDVAASGYVNTQLDEFSKTPHNCRSCHQQKLPAPVYDCGWDPTGMYKVQGGCPDNVQPVPMSIFDCVIFVHRQGEGQQSELVVSPPIPAQRFRTADGRPLSEHLKEPHLAASFDLLKMYAPSDVAKQAEIIGVPNPYGPPQQQGYQQYGGQQGAPPPYQPQPSYPPQGGYQQPPQQPGGYPQQGGYPPQAPPQQGYQQYPQPGAPAPAPNAPFGGRPNFQK